MNEKSLRELIGKKPSHFSGTDFEWRDLISNLLIEPDSKKTWAKNKQGKWERA